MSKNKKVTSSLFDNENITHARFLDFCMCLYQAMTASNTDGKYDDLLKQLQSVIDAVDQEINDTDAGTRVHKSSTSGVDQFIYNFGQFMKNNNGAIAYALGGNTMDAYYQFYPFKAEEYLTATKKKMPMLVGRVLNAANQYADSLGTNLTSDLQAFSPTHKKLLAIQRQQITNVKQNRIQRSDAFVQGQWALTGIFYNVASLNIGNPQEMEKLFPFSMLYPQKKSKVLTIKDKLAISESKPLLNRFLTDDVALTVQNIVVNADVMVWLAASPKDDAPATAVVVNANTKSTLKAGDLGDLKNPFLRIKNMSSMNIAEFEIDIAGLKKEVKTMAKEEQTAKGNSDALHIAS